MQPPKPGETEIIHTGVAAEGDRNLLAFYLIVTAPPEGKPVSHHVAVIRIVPEERAPTGVAFGNNRGKPEVKHVEEVAVGFDEPFQAYMIGDDYYFLTKSGLVCRSR